jgi:hypothetical protein
MERNPLDVDLQKLSETVQTLEFSRALDPVFHQLLPRNKIHFYSITGIIALVIHKRTFSL